MCGIAGIQSKVRIKQLEERISKMNSSIAHRGPDAGKYYIDDEYLALGHRRLSIIDTSEEANQPMHSHSGDWVIVFNGEIYNFVEIKELLNYPFKNSSDTEAILAAIEIKGIDWFLCQANGMFAMAIFNKRSKELFLVRDRIGIKPLYYFADDDKIVFSSEIKGILSSGLVEANFNEAAVDEYLANRYIREPYTFFENIFQVKAGTYIKIDANLKSKVIKYWDLPKVFNTEIDYDEEKLLHQFDVELSKSIKYRLISDVPLGTYLSGGVDSSLITAITAINKNKSVNTYTIGFPELNEFQYSQIVANKYKTNHHEVLMTKQSYIDNWERLIRFKDAPLGVPNEIPLAVLSKKLKEKITVVLSGEGADELMGGYGKIFRLPFDHKNSSSSKSFYEQLIADYEYVPRHMRDQFINTPTYYRKEFDDWIKEEFSGRSDEENIFRFFYKYHVKGLLQRVDITTMQSAVEARVPFLDHNLIEFVYSKVPYELKLRWKNPEAIEKATLLKAGNYSEKLDTPKYLIRKLSYKYLPTEIVERLKVGFPVPLTEWFGNLEELAKELLPNVKWLKSGVLDELVEKSKKEHRAGQILWMFINIEIFRRNYFEKDWTW